MFFRFQIKKKVLVCLLAAFAALAALGVAVGAAPGMIWTTQSKTWVALVLLAGVVFFGGTIFIPPLRRPLFEKTADDDLAKIELLLLLLISALGAASMLVSSTHSPYSYGEREARPDFSAPQTNTARRPG